MLPVKEVRIHHEPCLRKGPLEESPLEGGSLEGGPLEGGPLEYGPLEGGFSSSTSWIPEVLVVVAGRL